MGHPPARSPYGGNVDFARRWTEGVARATEGGDLTEAGHNSINSPQLRAFIERIERLEEEKRATAEDIKDVYAEAKGTGFDAKIIRKIVSLRRQDVRKRKEEEEILDLYLSALGMG